MPHWHWFVLQSAFSVAQRSPQLLCKLMQNSSASCMAQSFGLWVKWMLDREVSKLAMVVTSASEILEATPLVFPVPKRVMTLKILIMPLTAPSKPTSGSSTVMVLMMSRLCWACLVKRLTSPSSNRSHPWSSSGRCCCQRTISFPWLLFA